MADNSAGEANPRLDQELVRRGYFTSRSRARDAILRGTIRVDGKVAAKPGQSVALGGVIGVDDPARAYVSRAALKLVAGLEHFGIDTIGKSALDIGASTGGFTQVLLQGRVAHVVAVDVGHGQLDPTIASDNRVTSIEGLNARDLTIDHLEGLSPELIVTDVSFISLKLALPPALELAAPGARGMFLVKPQFEVGRGAIGKGGLLRDPAMGEETAQDLSNWLGTVPGWRTLGYCASPVAGGDGNREFLLGGVKSR